MESKEEEPKANGHVAMEMTAPASDEDSSPKLEREEKGE